MLKDVTDALLQLDGSVIYAVIAGLAFAEAALFFGFVFPGETAIVIGGVLASQGRVSVTVLAAIAVVAAITGDSVGYEIGRRFGPQLLGMRPLQKHQSKVERVQRLLRERGAYAVFLGRFTAIARALMPALAGSSRMPYGRFLLFNALGGIVWGAGYTFVGFFAGTAYERVQHVVGAGVAIVIAVLVLTALGVWMFRRHRRERSVEDKGGVGGEEAAETPERPDSELQPAFDAPRSPRTGRPAPGDQNRP